MQKDATPAVYTNRLSIHRICLSIRLGCEPEERKTPQPVEVDITFFFPSLTEASLKDTGEFVCYDKISHMVSNACGQREFRLIEFLGTEIHRMVRVAVAPEIKISVTVTKCNLPVEFVRGGASYSYSDLPPFAWVTP